MCEIKVMKEKDGENTEIMNEVMKIQVEGQEIRIIDILGRETMVSGTIKSIDLMSNVLQII
jgi:predicted RNA-binding protein